MKSYLPTQWIFAPKGNQHGLAALELVFVLPLLFILLLGTAEFGRVYYQYTTLNKLQRSAARYLSEQATGGATNPAQDIVSNTTVTDIAKRIIAYGVTEPGATKNTLPSLAVANIAVTLLDPPDDRHIKVTTTYAYKPIFIGSLPDFHGGTLNTEYTFKSSIVMRVL